MPDPKRLFEAVRSLDEDGLRGMLAPHGFAKGADEARDEHNRTLLHVCDELTPTVIVSLLFCHGADLNARDNDGLTPLHYVVRAPCRDFLRRSRFIQRLSEAGAQVNATDPEGRTSLHMSVRANDLRTMRCLILCGASLHIRDRHGWTPLDHILTKGGTGVRFIDFLAENGHLNVNLPNPWGQAPIHVAITTTQGDDVALVRRLLALGANPTLQDANGHTAFDLAAQSNNPALQALFGELAHQLFFAVLNRGIPRPPQFLPGMPPDMPPPGNRGP